MKWKVRLYKIFPVWTSRYLCWKMTKATKEILARGTVREIEETCDLWIKLGRELKMQFIVDAATQWKSKAPCIVMARVFKR